MKLGSTCFKNYYFYFPIFFRRFHLQCEVSAVRKHILKLTCAFSIITINNSWFQITCGNNHGFSQEIYDWLESVRWNSLVFWPMSNWMNLILLLVLNFPSLQFMILFFLFQLISFHFHRFANNLISTLELLHWFSVQYRYFKIPI